MVTPWYDIFIHSFIHRFIIHNLFIIIDNDNNRSSTVHSFYDYYNNLIMCNNVFLIMCVTYYDEDRGTQYPFQHRTLMWGYSLLLVLPDHVKQSGGKVLVHCEAGISRSPTICMAYIMRTERLQLEEAFDIIKKRRPFISPNFSFMGQLLQFESEVLSSAPAHVTPEPATPCAPEAASFFASDFTTTFNTKNFEPSVFTLPTSFLAPRPLQTPVHHQFKLSPITALP